MGRGCGCILVLVLILLVIGGVIWYRTNGDIAGAVRDSQANALAVQSTVVAEEREHEEWAVGAVMTQSANDIGVVADVAKNGNDNLAKVSMTAILASLAIHVSNALVVVLIVLGLFLVLMILAKMGGA